MDLILFLTLCLISLSSSQSTVKTSESTKPPTTTSLTTAKHLEASKLTSKLTDLINVPTTTPLPTANTSPKLLLINKVDESKISYVTDETLNGQEQSHRPFIRGRGRGQNGFGQLGSDTPNYNPNYGGGAPFNAFGPQGLPFSGSRDSNNGLNNNRRPGFYNPNRDRSGDDDDDNHNHHNHNNHQQRPISGPLDLLSRFIPTRGSAGSYSGTPTPFGQPVTGYPGYPDYPGSNPNYGPANARGLNNANRFGVGRGTPNVYNRLGGAGAPETGLADNAEEPEENEDTGADAGADTGADGEAAEDGNEASNGGENGGGDDQSDQADYGGASDTGETADTDSGQGEGEEGAGTGSEGEGGDPANDPDLAQFQNFQGGNFPGDLFPPGILSQQDLNDIQKSMEEQQKKEAEKQRQQEEGASSNQPDYDDTNANADGDGAEESSKEEISDNVDSNYRPIVPNHHRQSNQYNLPRRLNNVQDAYANNDRLNLQINDQYGLNSESYGNSQHKSGRSSQPNYQQNRFNDNIGYNNNNDRKSGDENQVYDYNGSGERGY